MFGLGVLHAGIAVLALLFSLEDPACVGLGTELFGPEFSKTFNAPTEKEKKAKEEEAAKAKLLDRAHKEAEPSLTEANRRNPSKADLSGLDRASAIAPNEAGFPLLKYTMLIAAGKPDEAAKALARAQQIYTAETGVDGKFVSIDPRLRRANTAAYMLRGQLENYLDPASPEAARVKAEMCRQVRLLTTLPRPSPEFEGWTDTKWWDKHNC